MDYKELFDITCRKCGSKNISVSGGSMDGQDIFQISCEDCENHYYEEETY